MDDRAAHFLKMVGDVCDSARLGGLPVRLKLDDGTELEDHPLPSLAEDEREVDDTGYANGILVGDRVIPLAHVVEVGVRRVED